MLMRFSLIKSGKEKTLKDRQSIDFRNYFSEHGRAEIHPLLAQ